MRSATAFVSTLAFASLLHAGEAKIHRGLAYTSTKNERHTLDVYSAAKGKNRPVVLWIHGGGWRKGDKSDVQKKPQAFVDRGYVFVSTNYRFVPDVSIKDSDKAPTASFLEVFGKTEASQRDLSPVTHVAKGKDIPPFLILHVADRAESKAQSHWLAEKLK